MSGDDELDKFLFSIPKSSKMETGADAKEKAQVEEVKGSASEAGETDLAVGFDPLDLVELEDQQRQLLAWLMRHPQASLADIEGAFELPREDLEGYLAQLVQEERIKSVEREGVTLYRVRIHGQVSRRLRGFPEDLWKKAGLDDE